MEEIIVLDSVDKYCKYHHQEVLHPLVSVIDFSIKYHIEKKGNLRLI